MCFTKRFYCRVIVHLFGIELAYVWLPKPVTLNQCLSMLGDQGDLVIGGGNVPVCVLHHILEVAIEALRPPVFYHILVSISPMLPP